MVYDCRVVAAAAAEIEEPGYEFEKLVKRPENDNAEAVAAALDAGLESVEGGGSCVPEDFEDHRQC
jgi:hypothetical protein